jgi:dTDP-4-dehydrorhamnose reductase
VGSRFVEISKRKNFLHYPKQVEFDITDPGDIRNIISSYNFSAVVNFAAYTDVNKAEDERGDKNGTCWQVNVEGVRNLVNAVKPYIERIHFIQISTDMVFSGSKDDPGPYKEDQPIGNELSKITWYGYTKGRAEKVVGGVLGDRASIVRIIYPVRAKFLHKLDYIGKALKLFDEGSLYPLFSDQKISITFIDELCDFLDKIIIANVRSISRRFKRYDNTP